MGSNTRRLQLFSYFLSSDRVLSSLCSPLFLPIDLPDRTRTPDKPSRALTGTSPNNSTRASIPTPTPRSTLFTTSPSVASTAGSDFTGIFPRLYRLSLFFLFSPLPPSSFVPSHCVRLIAWFPFDRTHAQSTRARSDNSRAGKNLSCLLFRETDSILTDQALTFLNSLDDIHSFQSWKINRNLIFQPTTTIV